MAHPLDTRCLEYLAEIIDVLKASNQHERVFHLVIDRIERLFRSQTCAIILIDLNSEYLSIENSFGLSHTFCKSFRQKLATGRVGKLLWTGRPVLIERGDEEAAAELELRLEHPFGSCACVQIGAAQRALGYLHVDAKDKDAFTQDDIKVMQLFADLAGIAVYKSRLYEDNLHLDRIDHETDLLKYEPFVQELNRTLGKAKDENEEFSIMILDVDNYKQIVNTYGYNTSRRFLREVGDLVKGFMRAIDVGGRYGRDEIIIMLPHTTAEDAVRSAKSLRQLVERKLFTDSEVRSTISIGVASYPANGRTMEDLLSSAREALFEAQRAGRNKVYHYVTEWSAKERILTHE
jgi:diguanylate cyclase (GGDEF)-like protein